MPSVTWLPTHAGRAPDACYARWWGLSKIPYLSRLAASWVATLYTAKSYPSLRTQCLRRLASPVFTPLGGSSVYTAWRVQCLRRLASPVFTPLSESSIYAAWRVQYLRRLARAQCLRRLASPVFTPLGGFLSCTKGLPIKNPRRSGDFLWAVFSRRSRRTAGTAHTGRRSSPGRWRGISIRRRGGRFRRRPLPSRCCNPRRGRSAALPVRFRG